MQYVYIFEHGEVRKSNKEPCKEHLVHIEMGLLTILRLYHRGESVIQTLVAEDVWEEVEWLLDEVTIETEEIK